MKAESNPRSNIALGKLFVLLIFRKSACAPGAALRTIAYELYRRREKHSSPPSMSHPLFPSFSPYSFSLSVLFFSFPLAPLPSTSTSLSLSRFSRSLSLHEHPSRALALLECYRVAQCLTCTLLYHPPLFRVLKIVRKKWRKFR